MMTFQELVNYIKDYESNTFFAKGAGLTNKEAIRLAEHCITYFVDNRLDGCLLDGWLDAIRS